MTGFQLNRKEISVSKLTAFNGEHFSEFQFQKEDSQDLAGFYVPFFFLSKLFIHF